MGIKRVVAFGRHHIWPVTAAAAAASTCAICGIVVAVNLMIHGPFLAGYFLGAFCGDVLIYGIGVPLLLWLPRRRAGTA